jgi:predicted ATPase
VIEHLERAAGFRRDDPPAARLDKLEALLARGTDRAGEAAPLVAALLSVPPEGRYPPLAMAPQRQREATIDVLVEQVAGLARRRPVLSVFEDLHWADPTTLEMLDRLVGRIVGERVLLL